MYLIISLDAGTSFVIITFVIVSRCLLNVNTMSLEVKKKCAAIVSEMLPPHLKTCRSSFLTS
jgi:hypothetical protein